MDWSTTAFLLMSVLGIQVPNVMNSKVMLGINLTKPIVVETLKALGKEVEIVISATNLPNHRTISMPNLFCIMYIRPIDTPEWTLYHTTETILKVRDAQFCRNPVIPLSWEDYMVKFEISDDNPFLKTQEHLAEFECTLHELLVASTASPPQKTYVLWKRNRITGKKLVPSKKARLTITLEELIDNNDELYIEMKGTNIEKLRGSLFGKTLKTRNSNPHVLIAKQTKDPTGFTMVYRTDIVRDTETLQWTPFDIPIRNLCNGDGTRSLEFTCFNCRPNGKRNYLGHFVTSLDEMRTKFSTGKSFDLLNIESKRADKISGQISFARLDTIKKPNFEKFIKSGLRLHCSIAIDFSEKNGKYRGPRSLHSLNPEDPSNNYKEAINSVVGILDDYDWDKKYSVLGFGGDGIREDFNINTDNTSCIGVDGVLELYHKSLSKITPSTPSSTVGLIRRVTQAVRSNTSRNKNDYFILVIFTSDYNDHYSIYYIGKAIEDASWLPISIIIVGVGDSPSEFAGMKELDNDLRKSFFLGERDIVQFVALNKFSGIPSDDGTASLNLAKELLEEVPKQVLSYMQFKGYEPDTALHSEVSENGMPEYNKPSQNMKPQNGYSQPSLFSQTTPPRTISIQA